MGIFESFNEFLTIGPAYALECLAAIICGAIIGMERESSGKPAGLRTSVMICLGSTLFTIMSFVMARKFGGDPTRIAAQIVTGIGFLGAGAILHMSGRGITGMTTASVIWLMAALGVMIGSGYLVSAVLISIAVLIILRGLRRIERGINNRNARTITIEVVGEEAMAGVESLMVVSEHLIKDIRITPQQGECSNIEITYMGVGLERVEFLRQLAGIDGVRLRSERFRGGGEGKGRQGHEGREGR